MKSSAFNLQQVISLFTCSQEKAGGSRELAVHSVTPDYGGTSWPMSIGVQVKPVEERIEATTILPLEHDYLLKWRRKHAFRKILHKEKGAQGKAKSHDIVAIAMCTQKGGKTVVTTLPIECKSTDFIGHAYYSELLAGYDRFDGYLNHNSLQDPDRYFKLRNIFNLLHRMALTSDGNQADGTPILEEAKHLAQDDPLMEPMVQTVETLFKRLASLSPAPVESAVEADPLAAARARGAQYAVKEWQKAENLSLEDAAAYSGQSTKLINQKRQSGELYALLPPSKTRGFRYPSWQFDVEPKRIAAALDSFVRAGASCWTIHSFMMRPHEALGGHTPADIIKDRGQPLDSLLSIIERRQSSEHGAS